MRLPEEPPPQLHMDMSQEHEWRQQRIAALEPFCVSHRPVSVPPQESSRQARERQERQQRVAELRTRRTHNESRRANSAQTRDYDDHERRMVQWNAQHAQDEIRDRQVAEQVQRLRVTQHMEDDMRREQEAESCL
jgi:hypothetical protein